MLSILIPTYDYDCLKLVTDLQQQCEELQAEIGTDNFDYEIIVADDAGKNPTITERNELMELLPQCRYVRRQENVGRALLCNWLFQKAGFEYLLLIDADAEVCTPDFIRTYWQQRHKADVLVGSIRTPQTAPRGHELRLKYEQAAEKKRSASYRNAHTSANFSTFNVWINRKVTDHYHFDERCVEYGYEDALWGVNLVKAGVSILHIENPLIHTGINSNITFLANSEAALRTLHRLGAPMTDFAGVSIVHKKLCRTPFRHLFTTLFSLTHSLMRRNLLSRWPSLLVFQLYKLGYYDRLTRD